MVGLYYRPPGTDLSLSQLEGAPLIKELASHKRVIVIGDFNVNLLSTTDAASSELVGLMSSFGLTQVVPEATCIILSSSTLLDHACVISGSCPSVLCALSTG